MAYRGCILGTILGICLNSFESPPCLYSCSGYAQLQVCHSHHYAFVVRSAQLTTSFLCLPKNSNIDGVFCEADYLPSRALVKTKSCGLTRFAYLRLWAQNLCILLQVIRGTNVVSVIFTLPRILTATRQMDKSSSSGRLELVE